MIDGHRPFLLIRPNPAELWNRRELRRTTPDSRAVAKQQKTVGTLRIRGHVKNFDPDKGPEPIPHEAR
jgi:hypothetical protein